MAEIWKPIIIEKQGVTYDYSGLYEVSNYGRVRNSRTGQLIKLLKNHGGYFYVGLYKHGKPTKFLVHRLVASVFIPNPENLPEVNHKDINPSNNSVDNLEWCTRRENMKHNTSKRKKGKIHDNAHRNVLTEEVKRKIDKVKNS